MRLLAINVNNNFYEISYSRDLTILQLCNILNIEIPCFCYHPKLSIAGNCRICLVQSNTSPKLLISCATVVSNGMCIFTGNSRVRESQEGILEFLLSNHPLDCPICDQGGECDLQDITLMLGSNKGRFYEKYKRAAEDFLVNNFLIKMIMTRCIHCTRCIRFFQEVGGSFDLGIIGRGVFSKVGFYISGNIDFELSGNVIDLCPVGALTSKTYSFQSRAWELNSVENLDVFNVLGSNIRLDLHNNKIIRVLPISDFTLNED